jgi:hypothetical protein
MRLPTDAEKQVRGSRWYEHQEPLDDRAVAPDRPKKPSSPVGHHRPNAASKLAIWTFLLLRSIPPQAVSW